MFSLIIPVSLACVAWNAEEASRQKAFQTRLRPVEAGQHKEGPEGPEGPCMLVLVVDALRHSFKVSKHLLN